MMKNTVKLFVKACQQSSQSAYAEFKKLLVSLETDETRKDALCFLSELQNYFYKEKPDNCHFQFLQQRVLDAKDATQHLQLLQFPSTFLPEAWSFTFYEGILRYPMAEYRNKKVVELGCGIGWITIALALRYSPDTIYGLDINPKAIVCAKLNLYLNAYSEDAQVKTLANGKSLIESVSFFESNLFSHFNQSDLVFDRIIGCIPQVLNPEPDVMEGLIAENSSDEYLHSLSNYFAKQGYIEDQFGLGLIASAVEQSIPLLRSNGKLILNLGGRPGRAVLERLMQRRGFEVRRIWQTQVEQAADTEIDTLVDIEQTTGHRFEFYMSESSSIPVDASTALAYANAGGKIYHSVDVYEAKMLFPDQVKSIYQSVDLLGGQSLKSAIDLTYDNFEDAEERYSFLAYLAVQLKKCQQFSYEQTAGLLFFRQQLAEFFRYYLKVDIQEKHIVVAPGRREIIKNLRENYRPQLTLVEKKLAPLIEPISPHPSNQVLQVPAQVEYLVKLIAELKPQLVITRLDEHEVQSSQLINQLVQCAIQHDTLLVIDLTDCINLSSQPPMYGIYRYLSVNGIAKNLILTAGLINNRVYQNYSINFTITNNHEITHHLVNAAELTYSRTPMLKQMYYAHLLEEMLYFQRTRILKVQNNNLTDIASTLTLSSAAKKAYSHPAIMGNHLSFNDKTIRMDFGENELATPMLLKQVIFESYLVRKWVANELSAEQPLRQLMAQRFNIPQSLYSPMVFGNGVAPIYSALLNLCSQENAQLIIPSGSYGYFNVAADYQNVSVVNLTTKEADDFKITAEGLQQCIQQELEQLCDATRVRKPIWLFLNAPIINPTGAIYSNEELNALLSVAQSYQVTFIMDSIFTGLEFYEDNSASNNGSSGLPPQWDLSANINAIAKNNEARLVVVGGISKEYAAGGLRYGYCWSSSSHLLHDLKQKISHKPHFTLNYAIRKLVTEQLAGESGISCHLQQQRKILMDRAKLLTETLQSLGWKVIMPKGGLFLVAKPELYAKENNLSAIEAGDLMTQKLLKESNIVINNSTWTGLPGYCRFVLSIKENDFIEVINRLKLI